MNRSIALFLAATLAPVAAAGAPPSPKPSPDRKEQPPPKRRRVVSDLSGFELLDQARLKDKPMVAGATRVLGAKPPVILAPRLGKAYAASPVFAWRDEGQRAAFVLWDEDGAELHAAEVEGGTYAWPGGAPSLADGRTYLWSVKAADAAAAPGSTAGIVMATAAERAGIERALLAARDPDPYREGLARAKAFVEARVWYDALAAYTGLIERFPDRPEAWEGRATLFAQIPALEARSDEDFARADALTSSRR
jgi:hypothetical protein